MSGQNPHPLRPSADEPDAVERAAAEWVLRRAQGMPGVEQEVFRRWLAEDPRHAEIFAEMEETSRLLDGLRAPAPQPAARPARAPVTSRRPLFLRPSFRAAVAVAALAAVAVVGWRALLPAASAFAESASTQVGGLRRLKLPDGSTVTLNTDSAVKVSYTEAERRVVLLRGEAFFTVAKNPARPFVVQAGQVAVRAVGTAFNVRLLPAAVNVLVTEGKVQLAQVVEAASQPGAPAPAADLGPVLTVGQVAQISFAADQEPAPAAMTIAPIAPKAASDALAWREGRLEFADVPLAEVIAEFNRYNQHKIVIDDPVLAARRFGGAFSARNIEPLLEVLQQSFGVVAEDRGDETVIRLAR